MVKGVAKTPVLGVSFDVVCAFSHNLPRPLALLIGTCVSESAVLRPLRPVNCATTVPPSGYTEAAGGGDTLSSSPVQLHMPPDVSEVPTGMPQDHR